MNNAQGFGKAAQPTSTPQLTPLEDFDEEEWEYTFRTGALATLWGMKAVFAAREWGKYKINVNVINPAVVTDAMLGYLNAHPEQAEAMLGQVPLRRRGDPVKDAGGLAVFLASSDADYLTGMTFQLDGGGSMHA